jgi:hypothetical protein
MSGSIELGVYTFATKWGDGDPGDPWGFGFYDGERHDRHFIVGNDGKQIRAGGYRRAAEADGKIGALLLENAAMLEATPPGAINLWEIIDKLKSIDQASLISAVAESISEYDRRQDDEET